jgi:hypothetical protein
VIVLCCVGIVLHDNYRVSERFSPPAQTSPYIQVTPPGANDVAIPLRGCHVHQTEGLVGDITRDDLKSFVEPETLGGQETVLNY